MLGSADTLALVSGTPNLEGGRACLATPSSAVGPAPSEQAGAEVSTGRRRAAEVGVQALAARQGFGR